MKIIRWDASARRFSPEKMQKVGLFSSEGFFLDLYCLEPGQTQKPHGILNDSSEQLVVLTLMVPPPQ